MTWSSGLIGALLVSSPDDTSDLVGALTSGELRVSAPVGQAAASFAVDEHRGTVSGDALLIGTPDGTDVAGRIEPLGHGRHMLQSVFRSLLPIALAHRLTSADAAAEALAAVDRDAAAFGEYPMLWPLLIGAWKRK